MNSSMGSADQLSLAYLSRRPLVQRARAWRLSHGHINCPGSRGSHRSGHRGGSHRELHLGLLKRPSHACSCWRRTRSRGKNSIRNSLKPLRNAMPTRSNTSHRHSWQLRRGVPRRTPVASYVSAVADWPRSPKKSSLVTSSDTRVLIGSGLASLQCLCAITPYWRPDPSTAS